MGETFLNVCIAKGTNSFRLALLQPEVRSISVYRSSRYIRRLLAVFSSERGLFLA